MFRILRMHVFEVEISDQFTGHAVLGLQETIEVEPVQRKRVKRGEPTQ
jgi:hypothetical protein